MSATPPQQFESGDTIFAASELYNDGSIPDLPDDALIARQGTRGVVINVGHIEEQPNKELYLVRFENDDLTLGPPIGCWPNEITGVSDDIKQVTDDIEQ